MELWGHSDRGRQRAIGERKGRSKCRGIIKKFPGGQNRVLSVGILFPVFVEKTELHRWDQLARRWAFWLNYAGPVLLLVEGESDCDKWPGRGDIVAPLRVAYEFAWETHRTSERESQRGCASRYFSWRIQFSTWPILSGAPFPPAYVNGLTAP
jgi:hypothetical protein